MSENIINMNNEVRSKSIHNDFRDSGSKFSKKIKKIEVKSKMIDNIKLNSIEKKLLSNKN
jgi:hypothetical protein